MPRAVGLASVKPRLWNAKRRIDRSHGLNAAAIADIVSDPFSQKWRKLASEDVVEFIDQREGRDAKGQPIRELLPDEKIKILQYPSRYFSRPHNVPPESRKQVYFPDFQVTLLRTPHLGPRFASFNVPLWFGKLDLKSYLKNLYDVGVYHVRSYVIYQNRSRDTPTTRYQRGKARNTTFKKKMTVQLVEPFIWPAEPSSQELNTGDFEKDQYWEIQQRGIEERREAQQEFASRPDFRNRRSLAEQASALFEGRAQWQPTWKELPPDRRVMEGQQRDHRKSMSSESKSSMLQ